MSIVLIAGCANTNAPTRPPRVAAYVDLTSGHSSWAEAARESGQGALVLSFALAKNGACDPVWGYSTAIDDSALTGNVRDLLDSGVEPIIATGGANGTYLETSCPDATALTDAYERILDVTGSRHLELDVEKPVPNERVAEALDNVVRDRGIDVTVTLPVGHARTGLTPGARRLLRALAAHDINATVNVLAMNFPHRDSWRQAITRAADMAARQVAAAWRLDSTTAYHRLGLAIMAGRNDTDAVTTLADARAIADYAHRHGIATLGLWSLARDNGRCPGRTVPANDCSGLAQRPYAFLSALSGARH